MLREAKAVNPTKLAFSALASLCAMLRTQPRFAARFERIKTGSLNVPEGGRHCLSNAKMRGAKNDEMSLLMSALIAPPSA
jgi:hypothetical protein